MVKLAERDGLQDQVIEEIRVLMTRRRISARQLGDMLGWSHSGVSRRLLGQIQLTIADLGEIAAALNVPVTDFFPAPGRGVITDTEWSSLLALAA